MMAYCDADATEAREGRASARCSYRRQLLKACLRSCSRLVIATLPQSVVALATDMETGGRDECYELQRHRNIGNGQRKDKIFWKIKDQQSVGVPMKSHLRSEHESVFSLSPFETRDTQLIFS
jgi:hypothetical protein